ncbi:Atp12 [Kluyveromyces lactis]|nr:Atp12 [Kluyveromyces lactis]
MLRLSRPFRLVSPTVLSRVRCYAQASPLGVDHSTENNLQTETNRLSKTLTKFWEQVSLEETPENVTIKLDSKPLRTPLGNPLTLPQSRKLLSVMVLNEWSNLPSLSVKPYVLPLTSLVSRCIDLEKANEDGVDPELVAKIGGNREKLTEGLLRYLDTDTLLVFSPENEYEGALRKAQDELYLPIISGVEKFLSQINKDKKEVKLQILDADLHGLRGNAQSEETREVAKQYLDSLSVWDLAIFEKTVLTTKSFICGLLLLLNKSATVTNIPELQVSMEDIARAATLETIYQVERWGEVEDTHDVDKRDVRRNIHAAAIVAFGPPTSSK